MSSIREIAKVVNVSASTVSRALNNSQAISSETRERVFEAARDLGYASSVGKRTSSTIALFSRAEIPNLLGGFLSVVVAGAMRAALDESFDVMLLNSLSEKHPGEGYASFLRRRGVSGVMLLGKDSPQIAGELASECFPAIIIGNRSDDPDVAYINASSRPTTRAVVEHLISLGHRRIGIATHSVLTPDHADRLAGYQEAHETSGVPMSRDLILQLPAHDQPAGVMMLDHFLQLSKPPTAIYFTNPLTTVGALMRCAQLSIRVPHELSIVGFDDSDIRRSTYPNFSAVRQDAAGLAREGAMWLIQQVRDSSGPPLRLTHDTTFEIEETTTLAPTNAIELISGAGSIQRGVPRTAGS
ncbi:MAG: LacI family DNA-binding transcriptional regulator [Planctomycetota bacterium]